jgi:hypothetical protein
MKPYNKLLPKKSESKKFVEVMPLTMCLQKWIFGQPRREVAEMKVCFSFPYIDCRHTGESTDDFDTHKNGKSCVR